MKILLIDQEPSTLEKIQTGLTRAGYRVLIAADSDVGLRLARTDQPDLIIMDLLLTGLDGLDLCQALREDVKTKNIPLMIITSLSVPDKNDPWQPTPNAKWQLLRYHTYLPKPIDLNHLVRKVEAILKPDITPKKASGPSVVVVTSEQDTLQIIKTALAEADFDVTTYTDLNKALPAIYSYLPASLIIDSSFLQDEKMWLPINRFQERHPTFSLILLHNGPLDLASEDQAAIDYILGRPIHPQQIVLAVQKSIQLRTLNVRVNTLSKQVLGLNWDLMDNKQTMQYQNEELDLKNRQLTQLSEIKETLTGMLVHDLKAPLAAIMGTLQFLQMDPNNTVSENSQRILSGGLAAGQQMLRMTHTLLDEQKLENNQLIFDIEPVDLEEPLATSLEMLSPLFNMQKVNVETLIDEDFPAIRADPIILQRIIENLLDNAIKYSPRNEVITVKAVRQDNMVEICIADRGDGIAPEHRDLVFDRFTQLQDPKIEKIRGGVGLGLAFCKLAVETMGGKIWVGSLNDIGTAFFFTLPIAEQ
jgi:signal transduction histidine kinase